MVSSLDSRVEGQQGAGLQLASLRRKTVELLQSNDASAAVVHARITPRRPHADSSRKPLTPA